mmetsp:Transcript_19429/g.39469  ORF Transcript_19429/g.39469 Transcript_19429/m.39469 type:complete len:217 (+) Transcript_19429:58-708(+)
MSFHFSSYFIYLSSSANSHVSSSCVCFRVVCCLPFSSNPSPCFYDDFRWYRRQFPIIWHLATSVPPCIRPHSRSHPSFEWPDRPFAWPWEHKRVYIHRHPNHCRAIANPTPWPWRTRTIGRPCTPRTIRPSVVAFVQRSTSPFQRPCVLPRSLSCHPSIDERCPLPSRQGPIARFPNSSSYTTWLDWAVPPNCPPVPKRPRRRVRPSCWPAYPICP